MNKNLKLTLISSAILIVIAGSLITLRVSQLKQKQNEINILVKNFESQLPKGLSQSITNNIGILESTGEYKLTYSNEQNKEKNSLIIDYKLEHGFYYLFSGNLKSSSIGKLDGPISQSFKNLNNLFSSNSIVYSNGNVDSDIDFSDLTLNDSLPFSISGIKYKFNYINNEQYIKTAFTVNDITSEIMSEKLNAKNLSFNYDTYLNQLKGGKFNFSIDSISDKNKVSNQELNNLSISSELKNSNENLNISSSIKVGNISAFTEKNASFELSYSISDIDAKPIQFFIDLLQHNPTPEMIQKQLAQIKNNTKTIIQNGFSLSIDKVHAKGSFGEVDFNAKITLPKSNSISEVSFSKNLTLDSTFTLSGNALKTVYTTFNSFALNKESSQDELDKLKSFTWKTKLINSSVLINEQQINEFPAATVTEILQNFDSQFQQY